MTLDPVTLRAETYAASLLQYGYDVSNYQGQFPHSEARKEGFTFFGAKITEGHGYVDPDAEWNISHGLSAGLIPCGYHFMDDQPGAVQADHFLSTLRQIAGSQFEHVGIMLDAEGGTLAEIQAFKAECVRQGRPNLVLYTGSWFWVGHLGNPASGPAIGPLWDSRYVSATGYASQEFQAVPTSWWTGRYGGWRNVSVLQFTDKAKISGELIDGDAFVGSADDLRRLFGIYVPPPAPAPTPTPQPTPTPAPVVPPTGGSMLVFADSDDAIIAQGILAETQVEASLTTSAVVARAAIAAGVKVIVSGGPAVSLIGYDKEAPSGKVTTLNGGKTVVCNGTTRVQTAAFLRQQVVA